MGVEARYQAIPEDCELLVRARQDRRWAEELEFLHSVKHDPAAMSIWHEDFPEFFKVMQAFLQKKPDVIERYFCGVARAYDAILYLLSPQRRTRYSESDQSVICKAIYGFELIHPEARATQGMPIGFVPARDVTAVAEYLAGITYTDLHEHYDPQRMYEKEVYKMAPNADESAFQFTWEEFVGMQNIYQQAMAHGEAMITVID